MDVRPARCFPWSVPDCYISLRDSEGREIVLLESLSQLDAASLRRSRESAPSSCDCSDSR